MLYFLSTQQYRLKIQIVCDNEKRIRHFVAGYPGSIHDSRVWNECALSKEFQTYFSDGS